MSEWVKSSRGDAQTKDRGDRRNDWYEYFQKTRGAWALDLLKKHPEIIEEHSLNPHSELGPMSGNLEGLLNYFRTSPLLGGLYIFVTVPWKEYAVAKLSARGERPDILPGPAYPSEAAAAHGVFLKRIEILKEAYGG